MTAVALLLLGLPLAAQQGALTPFQERKARDLLRTQLPCLGCHELDGDGGRNAPALTTVGERRSAAYIRAIIEDPARVVPGAAMPKTPMSGSARELVIRFVARHARGTDPARAMPEPPRAMRPDAAALYARWCASCHGVLGRGDGPDATHLPVKPAAHADANRMKDRPDDSLFDTIARGGAVMGRSARMPAFGETLSREEIRSLVRHIRTLCACQGPSWSRDGG